MKWVIIYDKKVPYELVYKYLLTLWTYTEDRVRGKTHDAIFDYLKVERWGEDEDKKVQKYFDALDTIICYAYVCCGLSVTRDNLCRKCETILTLSLSREY